MFVVNPHCDGRCVYLCSLNVSKSGKHGGRFDLLSVWRCGLRVYIEGTSGDIYMPLPPQMVTMVSRICPRSCWWVLHVGQHDGPQPNFVLLIDELFLWRDLISPGILRTGGG